MIALHARERPTLRRLQKHVDGRYQNCPTVVTYNGMVRLGTVRRRTPELRGASRVVPASFFLGPSATLRVSHECFWLQSPPRTLFSTLFPRTRVKASRCPDGAPHQSQPKNRRGLLPYSLMPLRRQAVPPQQLRASRFSKLYFQGCVTR